QAEDGIRDFDVTGVQTCALPISGADPPLRGRAVSAPRPRGLLPAALADRPLWYLSCGFFAGAAAAAGDATAAGVALIFQWAPLKIGRASSRGRVSHRSVACVCTR